MEGSAGLTHAAEADRDTAISFCLSVTGDGSTETLLVFTARAASRSTPTKIENRELLLQARLALAACYVVCDGRKVSSKPRRS